MYMCFYQHSLKHTHPQSHSHTVSSPLTLAIFLTPPPAPWPHISVATYATPPPRPPPPPSTTYSLTPLPRRRPLRITVGGATLDTVDRFANANDTCTNTTCAQQNSACMYVHVCQRMCCRTVYILYSLVYIIHTSDVILFCGFSKKPFPIIA